MTRVSALVFGTTRWATLERRSNNTIAGGNDVQPLSGHGGGSGPPYMSETNFDANMVIILAALLCALICALGLNSIVRCALRCSRRVVFESRDDVPVRLANTGLKRRVLRSLPVTVYAEGGASSTDCAICLTEFSKGDKVRVLPNCSHVFHVKCIDTWLLSNSSCPTCRQSLVQNNNNNNSNRDNNFPPGVDIAPAIPTDFSGISVEPANTRP